MARSRWSAAGGLPASVASTLTVIARRASELSSDPAIIVANPEVEVTAERFTAWLDRRQSDEPVRVPVRAEDTLTEIRASGEE